MSPKEAMEAVHAAAKVGHRCEGHVAGPQGPNFPPQLVVWNPQGGFVHLCAVPGWPFGCSKHTQKGIRI